ncbi:MAG TPA: gliding motility-associated C-terminal domain-containing protein [Bacteroidia bacterium]|nr:gliding motility-associated C-terminal domain-containing protein [Bacteroidia bacterium]
MAQKIVVAIATLLAIHHVSAQALVANAGNGGTICPGTTLTIGGGPTATGGTAPYTYQWTPATNLSSTTVSNPIANPNSPTWYWVTVTDAVGATATDSVFVDLYPIWNYNAGNDTSICVDSPPFLLGGQFNSSSGGTTYTWVPNLYLDNANAPRPTCSTTVTITYDVSITCPPCNTKTFTVTVTVNPLPIVDACCDQTIHEGQVANLSATGGVNYGWFGDNTISNPTGNPVTVEPLSSTDYVLVAQDANHCYNSDTVHITVIPEDSLYFYNTFSPNNDGTNDYFYIGNIYKYPNNRLEVFTRTGQQVYAKTGYQNDWDGTNYGDKLPEATYYFVLDPGDGTPKIYRSVTIIR